jgi:molecular chaperone GrpE
MRPEEERQGPVIRDRRRIDPVTGQVRDTGESGSKRGPTPAGGQPKPGKHSVSSPSGADAGEGGEAGGRPGKPAGSTATSAAGGESPDGARRAGGAAAGNAEAASASASANADPAAVQTAAMLAERIADLQRLQAEYANYRKRVERDRLAVREQALANVLHGLLPVLDDIGRAREHGELTGGFKSVADSLESIVAKLGLTPFGESGDPFDPTQHEALMHSYSNEVTEPTAVQILQPGYKVGERIIRPARVAVAEPADDTADAEQADEAGPAEPAEGGETAE